MINASPGDLEPVFDADPGEGNELCEPALGMLWTYDGERFFQEVVAGLPAFAESRDRREYPLYRKWPRQTHGW